MSSPRPVDPRARVEREDLVAFINAGMVATGQGEARQHAWLQRLSLDFLHDYIAGNYPDLYPRCLALGGGGEAGGLNHVNRLHIIARLLRRPAPADPQRRQEEAQLIAAALRRLPPQRVYRLLLNLAADRVGGRRIRAAIRQWLQGRDLTFDAVKYRRALGRVARHGHVALPGELGRFVYRGPDGQLKWATPLFEQVRKARRDPKALYGLPFTVAEGYASLHRVPRAKFLAGIQGQMTKRERSRLARNHSTGADLSRLPLGRLCRYVLGTPLADRQRQSDVLRRALDAATERAAQGSHLVLGHVVAVLDRSHDGSAARPNRQLSVAMGASRLLSRISRRYTALWTDPIEDDLYLSAAGRGRLAHLMQRALSARPEWVIVISDAFEEGQWGRAAQVAEIFKACMGQAGGPRVLLFNPTYDADEIMPRPLGPEIPVLGLSEPEHLPATLAFARFASGEASLAQLQAWLGDQAQRLIAADAPIPARQSAVR